MSASSSRAKENRPASSDSEPDINEKAPARPSSPADEPIAQQSVTVAGPSSSDPQWKGKQPIRNDYREQAPSPEADPWQPGRHEPKKYRKLLPAAAPAGSAENAEAHVFLGTVNHTLRETSKVAGYEEDYAPESDDECEDDEMPDLGEDEGSDDQRQRTFGRVVQSGNDVKDDSEWGGELDIDAQIAMMREYEEAALLREFGEAAAAAKEEEERLRPRRQAPEPPVAGPSKRTASGSPGEGPTSPTKKGRS